MDNPNHQAATPILAAATRPNEGRAKLKPLITTINITPTQLQAVTILLLRVARIKSVALKESGRLIK
jgi:hypothetical protein